MEMILTQTNRGWADGANRASIDGWATFATAAFLLGAGIFVLLDRIGAPERLVAALGPALALAGLATIGFMLRSMRISRFHAAGRATPGAYAGLAMAALGAGLAAPFAPPLPAGAPLGSVATGFGLGLALTALVTGPLLRKAGAFSIADLVAARFSSLTLRVGVTLAMGASGLCLGLGGLAMAQRGLVQATGLGSQASVLLAAFVVALIVSPGGMAGMVWAATGAAGLLIAGLAAPLALMIASGAAIPFPMIGDGAAFERALARMGQWGGGPEEASGLIVVALAIGLAALAPLLAPLMTTPRTGEARRGGLVGLGWFALLALMALVGAAASALALQSGVAGLRPADLPAFLLEASGRGLVEICGRHPATIAQAREACGALPGVAGALRAFDVSASGDYLVLGLSRLSGFGVAFSGLAMAGLIAIALALSAAGFLAMATALGDDAFYRAHKAYALKSRRLAVTRLLLLCAIAGATILLMKGAPEPRWLVALALGLSDVTVGPLLLLTLWPRAEGLDGAIALITGLAVAEAIILLPGQTPDVEVLAGAAVGGFLAAIAAGFAASFLHPSDDTSPGAAFVHGLLHGEGDVLRPDREA